MESTDSQGRVKEVNSFMKNFGAVFTGGSPQKVALKESGFNIDDAVLTPLFNTLNFVLSKL